MKNRLAFASSLMILVILILSGCTSPTTPGLQPSATPGVSINPTPVVTGDTITINGKGSGDYNIDLANGYYLIKVKYRGDIKVVLHGSGKAGLIMDASAFNGDGAARECSYIIQADSAETAKYAPGNNTIQVTARSSEAYTIELLKFPLTATPQDLPGTFKGKGSAVLGPLRLDDGELYFKYKVSNVESGFVAVTLAKLDGSGIGETCACNVDAGGKQVVDYDGTVMYDLEEAGTYYVVVEDSAPGHSWELTVSK